MGAREQAAWVDARIDRAVLSWMDVWMWMWMWMYTFVVV